MSVVVCCSVNRFFVDGVWFLVESFVGVCFCFLIVVCKYNSLIFCEVVKRLVRVRELFVYFYSVLCLLLFFFSSKC